MSSQQPQPSFSSPKSSKPTSTTSNINTSSTSPKHVDLGDEPTTTMTDTDFGSSPLRFALDLYRSLFANRNALLPVESLLTIRKLLYNIAQNPTEEKVKMLRLKNPIFDKKVVNAAGALRYLRGLGFVREHLVADNMNEQIFKFRGDPEALVIHVSALDALLSALEHGAEYLEVAGSPPFPLQLPVTLKVRLPDGQDIKASFGDGETVEDIRRWVASVREDAGAPPRHILPDLAAGWDASLSFDDHCAVIRELGLHLKSLIVKRVGDFEASRAIVDETEQKRRLEAEADRLATAQRAREKTAAKVNTRAEAEKSRLLNIQRFQEDRNLAQERAAHVVSVAKREGYALTQKDTNP